MFTTGHIFSFDREQWHERRFEGINLSDRILTDQKSTSNLSADISNIVISQSVTPATFTQENSSITALKNNEWLVAFEDNRFGSQKIFFQRYDSFGVEVETNILAAGSTSGADYIEAIIKSDSSGLIYLGCRDKTNGLIYLKKYNSDLSIHTPGFIVNDTTFDSFAGPFDFEVYPDGKIVIVWENYSILGSTVQMRLYDTNGNSTLGPQVVNSDGGSNSHWVPSVAVNPAGDYLVAWEDYRNGWADIFIILFNGAGNPIGSDLSIVPPPHNASDQYAPVVAYSSTDEFIIGWVDRRMNQEIYIQNYKTSVGLVGQNLLVSSGDAQFINWNLDLSVSSDGNLQADWAAFGPQNNIISQTFDTGLSLNGTPKVINNSLTGRRWKPSSTYNSNAQFAVTWTEFASDNSDIHLNIFNQSGSSIIGNEIKVNDDISGAVSSNPFVIPITNWYNLFIFEDQRFDDGDIFVQTVSNAGINLTSNTKVNQDIGNNLQKSPSAAVSMSQAKTLVVWVDSRDITGIPGQRIFGRFGNEFGVFSENEFILSDSFQTAVKTSPKAALDSNGKGLVVWTDNRDGSSQIYGQYISSNGSLDVSDFRISDILNDSSNVSPFVVCDSQNRFYVIWFDDINHRVRVKWYNTDGSTGGDFNWSSSLTGISIDEISAVVRASGNIVLLWTGINGNKILYLTELNNSGVELLSPIEITDANTINPTDPHIAVSNNNYITTVWVDRRDGKKAVYYQILDMGLNYFGGNTLVSSSSTEMMITPTTSAFNGRAWFTWVDPRENGMNVYASSSLYLPTDVEDNQTLLPAKHKLHQNYPNPFNPTTEISFNLGSKSKVKLTIFNLLGQEVITLADSYYDAGEHRLIWDGTNSENNKVTSGIYLYRLQAEEYVEAKKMILLK